MIIMRLSCELPIMSGSPKQYVYKNNSAAAPSRIWALSGSHCASRRSYGPFPLVVHVVLIGGFAGVSCTLQLTMCGDIDDAVTGRTTQGCR